MTMWSIDELDKIGTEELEIATVNKDQGEGLRHTRSGSQLRNGD